LNKFKPRVLAIDDDPHMLHIYKALFERDFAITIVTTSNPEKALIAALENPPDLFITDLFHPGMNGIALIKKLRERESTKVMPICVISGSVKTEYGDMAREAGADLVFSKPWKVEEFVNQVKALLTRQKWMNIVLLAHEKMARKTPSLSFKSCLLQNVKKGNVSNEQKRVFQEAEADVISLFFKIASRGQTFGSTDSIKKKFGYTLEENFGLTKGPFIEMARAYWSFSLGVDNTPPGHENLLLWQILHKVEFDIRSLFFPTPGPNHISVRKRIKAQRSLLQHFAPEMDIERFISENPILKREARRGLFSGKNILLGVILLLIIVWLLFNKLD